MKNLTKHQRRQAAPRFAEAAVKTPFLKQRRGSLILRLASGYSRKFRDVAHRSAAMAGLNAGRFNNVGEMRGALARCPNGFSSFLEGAALGDVVRLR